VNVARGVQVEIEIGVGAAEPADIDDGALDFRRLQILARDFSGDLVDDDAGGAVFREFSFKRKCSLRKRTKCGSGKAFIAGILWRVIWITWPMNGGSSARVYRRGGNHPPAHRSDR
jgi:hypothetical protein